MKVLITGGAGFIGSRLARRLSDQGASVTVLDNLSPQIHEQGADFPTELRAVSRCVQGDVRDRDTLCRALEGQEVIVHLAAETGTGQSMYEVDRYSQVNVGGTAILLDLLINGRPATLRKLVVASSRAIYGEGQYRCKEHGTTYPSPRTAEAMDKGIFEPACPVCGGLLEAVPTSECAPFAPSSFYGLTKQVQEQMVLMYAGTLGIDGVALRYQNVFGPGQSLSNPYTGILAVFTNLARQGKEINVFEDGLESRDFVYIDDVIDATTACISPRVRGIHSLNVGSGVRTTVMQVANAIVEHFGVEVPIRVTGAYRMGDIRHNVADISRIRAITGFSPKWDFKSGLQRFLEWAQESNPVEAGFEQSLTELRSRGLLGGGR